MSDKIGSPVEVIWTDATSRPNWASLKDHQDTPLAVVRSVGYLSLKTTRAVQVVQSYQDEPDGAVTDSLTIPRGWVRSIRRLR